MKAYLIILPTLAAILLCLSFFLGLIWGAVELDAHYAERQYQFEWELQQRTIAGLLDSAERMIEIIKE